MRSFPDMAAHLASRGLVWAFMALAGFCALAGAVQAAQISAVRIGPEATVTRVVIESDTAIDYSMFTLAEQGLRLVVDMPRVDWTISGEPVTSGQQRVQGAGMVSQYRFAHNTPQTSRLVLDLTAPVQVSNQFLLSPGADSPYYRQVLDLVPTGLAEFVASAGITQRLLQDVPVTAVAEALAPEASSAPPEARFTAGALVSKPVIVIDAGHGGRDSGAVGATGKLEKDVNLAAALALRDILHASGRYDVVLTRSTDIYLDLERRVAIARQHNADLFISLHADASANRETRGASIYTLSESGQARSRNTTRTNDWGREIAGGGRSTEVVDILVDLSVRDTKNQSSAFAEILIGQLVQVSPLLRNSHREAGYAVLLAPDVPAVLMEMGFMSNRQDEANLTSTTYRQNLMRAAAQAIDDYFTARQLQYAGG